MNLGLSIFLSWGGATLAGILLALIYYYIFENNDKD